MRKVSKQFDKDIRKITRNEFDVKVELGLFSDIDNEHIAISSTSPLNGLSKPIENLLYGNKSQANFASYDLDTYKADGQSMFSAIQSEYVLFDVYSNAQSSISNMNFYIDIDKSELPTSIPDLTLDFGDFNYPTDFNISYVGYSNTITGNKKGLFELGEALDGVNGRITIRIIKMNKPNVRFQIRRLLLGVGVVFTGNEIESIDFSSSANSISLELPSETMTARVIDFVGLYDFDNPNSHIHFFMKGQRVKLQIGYYLDDESIEWINYGSAEIDDWKYDNGMLIFGAKDWLSSYDFKYDGLDRVNTWNELLSKESYGKVASKSELGSFFDNSPPMLIRELMQVQANAKKSSMMFDENGVLIERDTKVQDYYFQVYDFDKNKHIEIKSISKEAPKDHYASYGLNQHRADGRDFFAPKSSANKDKFTGYVSHDVSDFNGKMPVRFLPVVQTVSTSHIMLSFEEEGMMNPMGTLYGLKIRFAKGYAKKIKITGYMNYPTTDNKFSYELENESEQFEFKDNSFATLFVIEFLETSEPNTRVYVDYMVMNSISDYEIFIRDIFDKKPEITYEEQYKYLDVVATKYLGSSTYENHIESTKKAGDENIQLITSDVMLYDLKTKNCKISRPVITGIINGYAYELDITSTTIDSEYSVTCVKGVKAENIKRTIISNNGGILVHNNPMIAYVTTGMIDWLTNYYKHNCIYAFQWRGDPRVQVNDVIRMENDYIGSMLIRIEKNTLRYIGGAFSMQTEGRRVDDVAYTENELD